MTHFYPHHALQRLEQRGSRRWLEFIEGLTEADPASPSVTAFTATMRTLRDALGLGSWLLTDPFNLMDVNFILDCYKGPEEQIFALYANYLAEGEKGEAA